MSQHTKVAIVTGAGTGVGRATALALLRTGIEWCSPVAARSRSRRWWRRRGLPPAGPWRFPPT